MIPFRTNRTKNRFTLPPANMEVHRALQKDYFPLGKVLCALPRVDILRQMEVVLSPVPGRLELLDLQIVGGLQLALVEHLALVLLHGFLVARRRKRHKRGKKRNLGKEVIHHRQASSRRALWKMDSESESSIFEVRADGSRSGADGSEPRKIREEN